MNDNYEKYFDNSLVTIKLKELYTDEAGFPNRKAFYDFVKDLAEEDKFRLICLTIDLTISNQKNYALGSRVMRTIVWRIMENFRIFRISGNKFNILVQDEQFPMLMSLLEEEHKEQYTLYYGVAEDIAITEETVEEARRVGVSLMYEDKASNRKGAKAIQNDKIIGNKGNTPLELRETETHKYKKTMWYGVIHISEFEPEVKDVNIYVFPTEYNGALIALNSIVIVDDLLDCKAYSGSNVRFKIDGVQFSVHSRFDNDGHLSIVCFKEDPNNTNFKYTILTDSHEGECIPASFGKRIGNEREIYPFKKNAFGTSNYALWDKKTNAVSVNTTGNITINNKNYAVYSDESEINLCELNTL